PEGYRDDERPTRWGYSPPHRGIVSQTEGPGSHVTGAHGRRSCGRRGSATGAVRRPYVGAPSAGVLAHLAELLLEVADLVAEPCRELEVQVRRCLVHLVAELLDQLGQLAGRQVVAALPRRDPGVSHHRARVGPATALAAG